MPQTRGDPRADKLANSDEVLEDMIKRVCSSVVQQLSSKLDEVDSKLLRMEKKFNDKLKKLDSLDKISEKLENLTFTVTSLSKSVSSNTDVINQLQINVATSAQSARLNSLRFYGIKEERDENVLNTISTFINNVLNVSCSENDINFAYRLGGTQGSRLATPRPILVNFVNFWKRAAVYNAKRNLKNVAVRVSIFEDLTKERYEALKMTKEKYGRDKAWTSNGNIFYIQDGKKLKLSFNQ